ncbi:type VI secretion system lipoprotein TssJ [Rubrivirga sp.]|uniref:type VI secretion system lipoprotein TssJ n=1 Tax=Rubrivirga sp. TaxID=1885344 RepID=UPI003B523974
MSRLVLLAVVLTVFAVSGCSGSGAARDDARDVTLAVAGAPGMNAGGNAAALQIFQLTDADPFTLVPVEEFWLGDDAVFAGTLVSRREILLYPREVRAVPLVLDARTAYVGVAADFRSPSLDGWRAVFPASRVLAEGLGVLVGDDALAITGPRVEPVSADSTADGR